MNAGKPFVLGKTANQQDAASDAAGGICIIRLLAASTRVECGAGSASVRR